MANIIKLKNKSNTLLITYNSKGLLLDTGYDNEDTKKIIQYLNNNNIELESVIVSHFHRDHIQGVKLISQVFPQVKFFSSETTKFVYENYRFENNLYSNLVNVIHTMDVEFNILKNTFRFYNIDINVIKSNGHCFGNLIFKVKDYLFCPDIIVNDDRFLPFISDVSSYFNEIDILKNLRGIKKIVLSHSKNTLSLCEFWIALDKTKNIINRYIYSIEKSIYQYEDFNSLIVNSINIGNRTGCFGTEISKEQYGYTVFVIKNILKFLEDKGKIKIDIKSNKIIIERIGYD